MIGRKINDQDNDHERLVYNSMIKIMITKPKKTPDHLVMIIQLMNIFMTCKDCAVSGLPQVVLRPPGVPKSYSVMPINCIVNGAIITRSENQLWVLLSPRETTAYEKTNNW